MEGTAPLRILGETAYPLTAASARVRVANHIPFLANHGISLAYRSTLSNRDYVVLSAPGSTAHKAGVIMRSAVRAARRPPAHDLLLIHRLRLIAPLPGFDPPRRLDVYDLDDAVFLGSSAEVNRRFGWVKQEARRSIACMRRARLVVAGNSFLASRAGEHARRVEVVPTCVDPDRQAVHQHADREVVTVGWIGSPSTVSYLTPVLPALYSINRERLRARLVVVGANTGAAAAWIEHVPWSLENENSLLASFDIGIMPLPDTDWARGKCGYKLLQYFSAGVPAVASPVGVSRQMVGDERGLIVRSPIGWHAALTQLIDDVDERRARGAAAREYVERNYSYRRWAPELARLLRSLVGEP